MSHTVCFWLANMKVMIREHNHGQDVWNSFTLLHVTSHLKFFFFSFVFHFPICMYACWMCMLLDDVIFFFNSASFCLFPQRSFLFFFLFFSFAACMHKKISKNFPFLRFRIFFFFLLFPRCRVTCQNSLWSLLGYRILACIYIPIQISVENIRFYRMVNCI